jgi:hypothetical protein
MERNIYRIGKELFITNDEEIKEGDKIINPTNEVQTCIGLEKGIGTDDICWIKVKETTTLQQILNSQKIILTTDQSLDGIQKIDDEFLEWFVKNPSFESVEVTKGSFNLSPMEKMLENEYVPKGTFDTYKIIIPLEKPKQTVQEYEQQGLEKYFEEPKEELELKDFETGDILDVLNMGNVEYLSNGDIIYNPNLFFVKRGDKWFIKTEEPKQDFYKIGDFHEHCDDGCKYHCTKGNTQLAECLKETLEEATKNWITKNSGIKSLLTPDFVRESFIEGAKWQMDRMYSEEEVRQIINSFEKLCYNYQSNKDWFPSKKSEWFEQFKK